MAAGSTSDLAVARLSEALAGRSLDVVVSGSIGAVESVRFIRALRRLGAEVQPWLTRGGARFITETSLAWAAGRPVRTGFSGDASHIALADAVIVAPASASLIGKIALGLTGTPAGALVQSHFGQGNPVLVLPNMHDSLASAPPVHNNLETLTGFPGVHILGDRREEGKHKFPEPAVLADEVAHRLNSKQARQRHVLVTMGTTRGAIDDVRYVSNYSSGALGSLIAEELYRLGFSTDVVAGPSPIRPRVYATLVHVTSNDEMETAARRSLTGGAAAAVLAASVLDFVPSHKETGKIASKDHATLTLELKRTRKLITDLSPATGIKVGFKLETGLTPERAGVLAAKYTSDYGLSLMVINDLADVDESRHAALLYEQPKGGKALAPVRVDGKAAVALRVAGHVAARLAAEG